MGVGYGVLIVLTAGSALSLWGVPQIQTRENNASARMGPPPTRRQKLKWLALAFIPSILVLGVPTTLTTELPPIPLLWVLPLAVYLLSFILVFAQRPVESHAAVIETMPILLVVAAFPIASKFVPFPIFAILLSLILLPSGIF
jgi:hypothetical protein